MVPTRPQLDLNFVRQQFPSERWRQPFFENAGGAFVPHSVISHMLSYMTEAQVQTGYPSSVSQAATKRVNAGLQAMAQFIGASDTEITLGASTSLNVYVLAQALRHLWQPGDEIVVSDLNHESNSGPWRRLEEFGIKIVNWPADKHTGQLSEVELEALLSKRTRLVAFPHVSNITGDINDVAMITALCHRFGALVCVDGVAYAPHRAIDVKKWNVDIYLFSFYKVFGPHLGLMYTKLDLLAKCKGQYHYFFPDDDLAHKLNPAGPNHETIACLVGIAEYIEALYQHHFSDHSANYFAQTQAVFTLIAQHEERLACRFLEFVQSEPRLVLIGNNSGASSSRVPTFSLQAQGAKAQDLCKQLAAEGIATGAGHFYAKRFLDAMDLEEKEVLRCSMAHYTTLDDVDSLTAALQTLLAKG